jgi:uncharacterized protein (TIGR03067 family)
MYASLVTVAVVGSLLAAEDRAKLQGTWTVVATKCGDHSKEAVEACRKYDEHYSQTLVFRVDQGATRMIMPWYTDDKRKERGTNNTVERFTCKIDPTKHPKEMDLCPIDPEQPDSPQQIVYDLNGDTLKLCYSDIRPKELAPGSGGILLVLKRKKP